MWQRSPACPRQPELHRAQKRTNASGDPTRPAVRERTKCGSTRRQAGGSRSYIKRENAHTQVVTRRNSLFGDARNRARKRTHANRQPTRPAVRRRTKRGGARRHAGCSQSHIEPENAHRQVVSRLDTVFGDTRNVVDGLGGHVSNEVVSRSHNGITKMDGISDDELKDRSRPERKAAPNWKDDHTAQRPGRAKKTPR